MFVSKQKFEHLEARFETQMHRASERIRELEQENIALRAHLGLELDYAPSKYVLRDKQPRA